MKSSRLHRLSWRRTDNIFKRRGKSGVRSSGGIARFGRSRKTDHFLGKEGELSLLHMSATTPRGGEESSAPRASWLAVPMFGKKNRESGGNPGRKGKRGTTPEEEEKRYRHGKG